MTEEQTVFPEKLKMTKNLGVSVRRMLEVILRDLLLRI